ncbi:type II toxin-antitoxin system VapC family toxin [Aureimonas leprariae]|nr:type II toxin-antitoxin system VapC family toxin [Aureimonas leprariae]
MRPSIYLDTNAIIAFVEQRHAGLELLFAHAERGLVELLTSELTLAEVLVRPLQRAEDWLLQLYEGLLVEDRVVGMKSISLDILRRSAAIRAATGGKTPDSIHVATAIAGECAYLVSSDRRLRVPEGLRKIAADEIDGTLIRSWG